MHQHPLSPWHNDCANNRSHHLADDFRHPGEHISHKMHPAALPRRTLERDLDRTNKANVCIADDELHTG